MQRGKTGAEWTLVEKDTARVKGKEKGLLGREEKRAGLKLCWKN